MWHSLSRGKRAAAVIFALNLVVLALITVLHARGAVFDAIQYPKVG